MPGHFKDTTANTNWFINTNTNMKKIFVRAAYSNDKKFKLFFDIEVSMANEHSVQKQYLALVFIRKVYRWRVSNKSKEKHRMDNGDD